MLKGLSKEHVSGECEDESNCFNVFLWLKAVFASQHAEEGSLFCVKSSIGKKRTITSVSCATVTAFFWVFMLYSSFLCFCRTANQFLTCMQQWATTIACHEDRQMIPEEKTFEVSLLWNKYLLSCSNTTNINENMDWISLCCRCYEKKTSNFVKISQKCIFYGTYIFCRNKVGTREVKLLRKLVYFLSEQGWNIGNWTFT